jgi:hypothetical protein
VGSEEFALRVIVISVLLDELSDGQVDLIPADALSSEGLMAGGSGVRVGGSKPVSLEDGFDPFGDGLEGPAARLSQRSRHHRRCGFSWGGVRGRRQ